MILETACIQIVSKFRCSVLNQPNGIFCSRWVVKFQCLYKYIVSLIVVKLIQVICQDPFNLFSLPIQIYALVFFLLTHLQITCPGCRSDDWEFHMGSEDVVFDFVMGQWKLCFMVHELCLLWCFSLFCTCTFALKETVEM